MPALPVQYQERVFFHIGMTSESAYTAEDKATALKALNNISSQEVIDRYLIPSIDRLDDLWERLNPDSTQRFSYKEQVSGDLNRAVIRDDPRSISRDWRIIYDKAVDELCHKFGLPNYNDPGSRWIYLRSDNGSYINSIPGPADTSVSSRQVERINLGSGGFGVMIA